MKMVLIHATGRSEEHRKRRDRIFRFISGVRDVTWAEHERNKKNALHGFAKGNIRGVSPCESRPISSSDLERSVPRLPTYSPSALAIALSE